MMPDFARSLFGFGRAKADSPSLPQDRVSPYQSTSELPTAGNSRTASVSGAFAPSTSKATTALSTAEGMDHVMRDLTAAQLQQQLQEESSGDIIEEGDASSRLKGKMKVRIIEARGLKIISGSSKPYVICTFDSSEHISEGPAYHGPSNTAHPINGHPMGIAIPSRSRQSSSLSLAALNNTHSNPSNPIWKDEAQFDVTSERSLLDISIYDGNNGDAFLGSARHIPNLKDKRIVDTWLKLEPRVHGEHVTGQVRVSIIFEEVSKRQYGPQDFEILRLIGKGTFGQVYQVRKKDTKRIYAMKVLSKRAIVQKKEIAHTIGERNILVRTTVAKSSFIVGLKFSFQTPTDLYLVTDYMSGGELFWHLQKEGRFKEDRAKFYIAELILALENLHDNDIVYRDLKPENVLLDANGHVALCDFGLSKANPAGGRTNTFCGTTEYLAPEVLLDDQGYTKMVDFWSLGVLVFEMCCGWSPFYAEDNQQMYKNIAFGKVRFPKDALSTEGRNFVKGLLNRNPKHRLGAVDDARELRRHPFFADVDWDLLMIKKIPPPFKPHLTSETDTSNFDPEFTQASTSSLNRSFMNASTPLSPGIQANFQGFTYVGDSSLEEKFRNYNGLSTSRMSRSYIEQDDDIDLYDDNDILQSQSQYPDINGSTIAKHLMNQRTSNVNDDSNRMDEDSDPEMMDEDDQDFVNGQRFEL